MCYLVFWTKNRFMCNNKVTYLDTLYDNNTKKRYDPIFANLLKRFQGNNQ